jgi:uncharacterized membrane protein
MRLATSMKDPLVKGHPLHAMLSDIPIGALVTSVVLDAIWLANPVQEWRMAAEVALLVTVCGAVLAASAGLWDWFGIPGDHQSKSTAAYHGWINSAGLVLMIASLVVHWRLGTIAGPILTFAALAVAGVAGWLGGELVFRQGWRVTPAEYAEQLEAQLRDEGQSDRVRRVHEDVRQYERENTLLP